MSCDSKKVFKGLELLYPRRILKNKANFRDLPLLGYVEADELAPLEEEYRREDFALESLLIPSSTVMVERIFTQVTFIKSKC